MSTTNKLSFKQGSLLLPKQSIQFKSDANRVVRLTPGQSVWVCNSQLDQQASGVVKLARSGRGSGYAWPFSLEDAGKYFNPISQ